MRTWLDSLIVDDKVGVITHNGMFYKDTVVSIETDIITESRDQIRRFFDKETGYLLFVPRNNWLRLIPLTDSIDLQVYKHELYLHELDVKGA